MKRVNKIDRIIQTENSLRNGVDPRKIFLYLRGESKEDSKNFDYFTVYLSGVGCNWIVKEGNTYKILSRDIWYTYAGTFKNGRCTVTMNEDKNWIREDGSILLPDLWLSNTRDFDNNGIAIGKIDGKSTWFDKEGTKTSEFQYDSIGKPDNVPNLYLIHENDKGYNIARCDGIPILSTWYVYPPSIFPNEKSVTITREIDSTTEDSKIEFQIIDLEEKELTPWYDWISGVSDGYAVVIDNSRDKRYNFINSSGELITPEWYTSAAAFVNGKGRVSDGNNMYTIDITGKLTKEP